MIILASKSKARNEMLKNAGLEFTSQPAELDEEELILQHKKAGKETAEIAQMLAVEKARAISLQHKDALVIGSDQILECEGQLLTKAENKEQALEKLNFLKGKTHRLISAVALCKNGEMIWQDKGEAFLSMLNGDDAFLKRYVQQAGEALTRSVGAYELESIGVQLFEKIEGDYFTILGMPLLKLLSRLREEGISI